MEYGEEGDEDQMLNMDEGQMMDQDMEDYGDEVGEDSIVSYNISLNFLILG